MALSAAGRPSMPKAQLSGFNPNSELVLLRRKGTGCIGRKSARRIVRFVEIESDLSILGHGRIQKPSRRVSFLPGSQILENEKQRIAFCHRVQLDRVAIESELDVARACFLS